MADKQSSEGKNVGTVTINADVSDALKGLKAVQREVKKTTAALKGVQEQQKRNRTLLTIELDDETSVPRVFYDGGEITEKVRVNFDWETKTDRPGKLVTNIEYYEMDSEGYPQTMGIGIDRVNKVDEGDIE